MRHLKLRCTVNQSRLHEIKTWTDADLLTILPKCENADFEFKSSLIGDGKLLTVIRKAASGFWNSGGGYFIVGVDEKTGQPDGGILTTVGRQSRKDWLDRQISSVSPNYPKGYMIQEITGAGAGLNITAGNAVYIVGFASSELVPHMADGCYYIRAGAHTDPASAFLVESLFARRGRRQPQLRLQIRRHPLLESVLQLGIVNVALVPAIDIQIEFEKAPTGVRQDQNTGKAIERVNLIDRDAPFYLDYANRPMTPTEPKDPLSTEANRITLRYRDPLLENYEQVENLNPLLAVDVPALGGNVSDRIAHSLQRISGTLSTISSRMLGLNEKRQE